MFKSRTVTFVDSVGRKSKRNSIEFEFDIEKKKEFNY